VITGSVVRYRALGWSCLSAQVFVGRRCMSSPTAIDYLAGQSAVACQQTPAPRGGATSASQVKSSRFMSMAFNSNTCRSAKQAAGYNSLFIKMTGYIASYAPIEQTMSMFSRIRQTSHRFSFTWLYRLKAQKHRMRDVAVHFPAC
jgi:hypothetical protein